MSRMGGGAAAAEVDDSVETDKVLESLQLQLGKLQVNHSEARNALSQAEAEHRVMLQSLNSKECTVSAAERKRLLNGASSCISRAKSKVNNFVTQIDMLVKKHECLLLKQYVEYCQNLLKDNGIVFEPYESKSLLSEEVLVSSPMPPKPSPRKRVRKRKNTGDSGYNADAMADDSDADYVPSETSRSSRRPRSSSSSAVPTTRRSARHMRLCLKNQLIKRLRMA